MDLIDSDIEINGEYRNRSEWILAAMRNFLDHRTRMVAERRKTLEDNSDNC